MNGIEDDTMSVDLALLPFRIYVCDRPERYEIVKQEMSSTSSCGRYCTNTAVRPSFAKSSKIHLGIPAIQVMKDGHLVSRISDFIIYSVEAEYIDAVVKEYGPCEYFKNRLGFQD